MRCLTSMGSRATSIPMMEVEPAVGTMKVVRTPMVVVFPAPLGPRRPKISPRDTSKLTPSTALVLDLVYCLMRLVTVIAGTSGSAMVIYSLYHWGKAQAEACTTKHKEYIKWVRWCRFKRAGWPTNRSFADTGDTFSLLLRQ